MNTTISSAPNDISSKRPLWYGLALWLNPLVTWGLLWAIFSLNPLPHKVFLVDTSEWPRTVSIEAILRDGDFAGRVGSSRILVPDSERDTILALEGQTQDTTLSITPAVLIPPRFPGYAANVSAGNPGMIYGAVSGSVPYDSN